MHDLRCEFCDSDCNSASELLACEIRCERDDHNTRGWAKRYDFHRKD